MLLITDDLVFGSVVLFHFDINNCTKEYLYRQIAYLIIIKIFTLNQNAVQMFVISAIVIESFIFTTVLMSHHIY